MRIVSFNVNGLRSIKEYYSVLKGWTFDQFLDSLHSDIICLQESKINDVFKLEREYALPNQYSAFYTFQRAAKKIGYSGVVTFCCRKSWEPSAYEEGFTGLLGDKLIESNEGLLRQFDTDTLLMLDSEGRCMITDHGHFILIHVYFPNYSGPERTQFREPFYNAIWQRCLEFLRAGRSLILLGDINVSYHPIDHCEYATAYKDLCTRIGYKRAEELISLYHSSSGWDDTVTPPDRHVIETFYTDRPMRSWLYRLLFCDEEAQLHGLRDAYRSLHPQKYEKYTCWSTLISARGTNRGSRIDLILVAGPLFKDPDVIVECDLQTDVMGSDHCPVYLDLKLDPFPVERPAVPSNLKVHHTQKRLSDFFTKKSDQSNDEHSHIESSQTTDSKREKKTKLTGSGKITDFFPVATVKTDPVNEAELEDFERQAEANSIANTEFKGIFNKPPPPPLCRGHSEPCKMMTVSKCGPNRGRKFYICARGAGDKNDPNARCEHFEWRTGGKKG